MAVAADCEVWAFLESTDGRLHETAAKVAFEARRVGRLLGARACGVVPAEADPALLANLARSGLETIYRFAGDPSAPWTPETCAAAVASLAARRSPHCLLFAATALGTEVAARVAARLRSGLASRCVDFEKRGDDLVARRVVHGGKAHATVGWSTPPPHLATVDLEALEAGEEGNRGSIDIVDETIGVGPPRTQCLRRWRVSTHDIDLAEARLVLGIGKPVLARPERMPMIREVAQRLGAALGASRIVVDAGLLPKDRQIGASGRWLAADVYVACGISGSSYHMMGVKGVKHLVAINVDPGAPIFQFAEVGIVGDLFEVLPAFAECLEHERTEKEGAA